MSSNVIKCWYIVVVSLSFTSPACTLPNPRHHCHWVAPTPTPRPHVRTWWQVTTKSTKLLKPPKPSENSPILPACSSPSVAARAVPQRPGETAPVCPMTCMSSSDQQHTTIENMVSTELESQDLLWIYKFNNLYNQYDLVCSKNVCHELSWMLMPLQQVQHRPEKACVVPRCIRTFAPSLVHGPNPDDVNLRSCKLIKLIRLLWF